MNNLINPPAIIENADLGATYQALQNVIERNALELSRVKNEIKLKRESLKNLFDNDSELSEVTERVNKLTDEVKLRKSRVANRPEALQLKVQVGELNEQKKEIEEALSHHLINYHQLTGSKSFDTSSGDQCEFEIKAKVNAKQLSLFTK